MSLNQIGYQVKNVEEVMEKLFIMICLLLTSFATLATEAVQIKCSSGTLLSVQGVLENDIFIGTIVVSVGATQVLSLNNLKYQKTQDSGEYYKLIEDEVASQAKFDDIYFVPNLLLLSPAKKSQVFLWLPIIDDHGENSPILVRVFMGCDQQ